VKARQALFHIIKMPDFLNTFIPDSSKKPYDMKQLITKVVDEGYFLEIQQHFAQNIIATRNTSHPSLRHT